MFKPTSTFTVFRGSAENVFGDSVDQDVIVAEGVYGSVIEKTKTVFNPSDNRTSVVSELTGRFKATTDIRDGDRLKDERNGNVFVVNAIPLSASLVQVSDVVVDLTRVYS